MLVGPAAAVELEVEVEVEVEVEEPTCSVGAEVSLFFGDGVGRGGSMVGWLNGQLTE
jgi:hypothetical protein